MSTEMGTNKVWEWEEAMERLGNFLEWSRGKWTLGLLNLHLLSRRTLVICPFWGYLCRLWLSHTWVKAVDSKRHLWDHLIPKLPSGPTLCFVFFFFFFKKPQNRMTSNNSCFLSQNYLSWLNSFRWFFAPYRWSCSLLKLDCAEMHKIIIYMDVNWCLF